jgi:hypothetical protein
VPKGLRLITHRSTTTAASSLAVRRVAEGGGEEERRGGEGPNIERDFPEHVRIFSPLFFCSTHGSMISRLDQHVAARRKRRKRQDEQGAKRDLPNRRGYSAIGRGQERTGRSKRKGAGRTVARECQRTSGGLRADLTDDKIR